MNSSTLNIAIEVDDKGSVKLRELGKTAKGAGEKGEKSMTGMRGAINKLKGDTDLSIGSFVKMGGVAFTATLAGITALAAGVVSLITSSAAEAREMENLSRLAQMNSVGFQNAAFATRGFGVDQDKLADISKDTLEKLGEFSATGGGGFKDFFDNIGDKIGLTAKELQGLSGPDVLVAVTAAMDDANLSYEQQSFYLESIASDTTMLIPLLKDHGAALKEQTDRADELGLAISGVETKRLVEAQRATNELTTAMGSLKTHIAASLAPAFTDVAGKIMDGMTEGAGGVDNLAETISDKLLVGLGYAVETMRFFHNGWLGIKLVGTVAIDAIAQSVEWLYGGLRLMLKPLDMAMEGLVLLGAIDVNPFDSMEDALGTFAASSRDVTNDVLADIDKTNAGYDSIVATIDGYRATVVASGDVAGVVAGKQVKSLESVAAKARETTGTTGDYFEDLKESAVGSGGSATKIFDFLGKSLGELEDQGGYSLLTGDGSIKSSFTTLDTDVQAKSKGMFGAVAFDVKDFTQVTAEELTANASEWGTFTGNIASNFGTFKDTLIAGDFKNIGDAWDGLWGSMVSTVVDSVAKIVAQKATSVIVDTVGTILFHDGTTEVKDDEVDARLQVGEAVIPRAEAAVISANLNSFGYGGKDFTGLTEASALYRDYMSSGDGESRSYDGGEVGDMGGITAAGVKTGLSTAVSMGLMGALGLGVGLDARTLGQLATKTTLGMVKEEAYGKLGTTPTSAAVDIGSVIGSLIGSVFGPIGSLLGSIIGGYATSSISDLSIDTSYDRSTDADSYGGDEGFGSDIGDNADGGGDSGRGGQGAEGPDHSGEGTAVAHTGGYLAQDEGKITVQTGEGVLSRIGMANLHSLNVGEDASRRAGNQGNNSDTMEGTDIKRLLFDIVSATKKAAKLLERFDDAGLRVRAPV